MARLPLHEWKAVLRKTFDMQGGCCFFCGKALVKRRGRANSASYHHTDDRSLVAACHGCHKQHHWDERRAQLREAC